MAAAGRGERAGSTQDPPKQFRPLGGRPVVVWSLERFLEAGCGPVVLVVPADEVGSAHHFLGLPSEVVVAAGGATRQASVASGLDEIAAPKVLVHDAARPLVSLELIERVVAALATHRAVVPGIEIEDTIKRASDGLVTETVDRSRLVGIQTPQGFETDLLRRAHERAAAEGYTATDDSGLVEHLGVQVAVVQGERSNVKLTYPGDFEIAEALVRGLSG